MTPQELKNSVLQLAIQGRLVEQRPEEAPPGNFLPRFRKKSSGWFKREKSKLTKKLNQFQMTQFRLIYLILGCGYVLAI